VGKVNGDILCFGEKECGDKKIMFGEMEIRK
jgi:hypothetical protein